MNKKLALLAGVAILIAVVVVVWARRGRTGGHAKSADTKSVHATSFDETDTSVSLMTMLNAPEGATPCETGYNALEAEQKATKLRGGKSMFKWVAAKDEFLAQCKTLSEKAQQCLAPRYRREHSDCTLARPPDAVLQKMFIPEPVVEEKIPGEE
jgi:hypothetical protein